MWISSFFSIFHYICFDYIYWNAILCLSSLIIKKFRLLFSVTIFSFHISNNSFVLNFTKVSWPVAHWRLKTKQNKANSQPLTTESLRNCLRLSRGRKLSLKDQMVNILGLQAMKSLSQLLNSAVVAKRMGMTSFQCNFLYKNRSSSWLTSPPAFSLPPRPPV